MENFTADTKAEAAIAAFDAECEKYHANPDARGAWDAYKAAFAAAAMYPEAQREHAAAAYKK